MGVEYTILGQTAEIIRLLRALDLGVKPAPTADFAVDMFDRSDRSTLGSYWEGEEKFSILSGVAHSMAQTTFASSNLARATTVVSSTIAATAAGYIVAPLSTAIYRATITSTNMTVKVTASAGSGLVDYARLYAANWSYYTLPGSGTVTETPRQIGLYTGACIADGGVAVDAVGVTRCVVPSVYAEAEAESGATPGLIYRQEASLAGPRSLMRVLQGNEMYSSVAKAGSFSSLSVAQTVINNVAVTAKCEIFGGLGAEDVLPAVGDITVTMVCSDDIVTASVSGVEVYTSQSMLVPYRSRLRAGIAGPKANVVGLMDSLGITPGGTREFKVWRNDIPEPPNQTGHGTYKDGTWHYSDKYHTPIEDAEGNITGYTYDPEA